MFNHLGAYLTPARRRWLALGLTFVTVATMGGAIALTARSSDAAPAVPGLWAGRTDASFQAICTWSHRNDDDPIVFPGERGKSHTHDFYGNRQTDAFSTADTLRGGGTTCNNPFDKAGYWVANLRKDGQPLTARTMITTYQARFKRRVQPFPPGLKILSGNANTRGPQALSTVEWSCNDDLSHASASVIPDCPEDGHPLTMTVWFPDCWNGSDLDSPNHISHMAFSRDGRCPADHPVPVPGLKETVFWPDQKSGRGLSLASGGTMTGHADFVNSWDQAGHAAFVTQFLDVLNPGNPLGTVLDGPLRNAIGRTAGPANRPRSTEAEDQAAVSMQPMSMPGMAMGN
ncbi:DUF1996 domain-containing protein [Kutzneria viridogrisea]